MVIDDKQSAIVSCIEAAFATVPYPGHGKIAYNQDYRPSDGWNCAEVFRGKHWRNVQPESLLNCTISLLTPEAFYYYLPTYMLARLEHPEQADIAGDFIVYALAIPHDASRRITWLKTMEQLNDTQKRAVRRFLEFVSHDLQDIPIQQDAKKALDEYWSRY